MNLFNTQTPIEPTNPQVLDYIKQQQYNQELTLSDDRSYILLTTCLFEAILNEYSSQLLPRDIIFLLQIFNLYSAALNKKQKTIIYSSEKLAKLVGYKAKDKSNMRSIVLKLVKKIEQLGLLNVTRHKDKKGSDKVNEIVPILPDRLYDKIKYESSNFNVDSSRLAGESNIQHILRTKLFTPIDLEFSKSLFDDATITATHKIFFLNCIITAYKNYQTTGALSFSATAKELINKNNISKRTLARILDYIKNQYPNYFIKVGHNYAKSDDIDSNRYDKSTFIISINPIVIPKSFLNNNNVEVKEEIDKTKTVEEKVEYIGIDNASLVVDNDTEKPDTYKGFQAGLPKKQPGSAKKAAHNNKDIIIKESNKNIDAQNEELDKLDENYQIRPKTFLQTSNSEHLESELCSLSSKSLKNSIKDFMDALPLTSNSIIEDVTKTSNDNIPKKNKINIGNNFNTVTPKKPSSSPKVSNDRTHKDFRHFYPLSEKDVSILNSRAGREFSTNFVNQLLLKLYIKYPEKRFKNKFTFLSYMVQILKNEKHQGPLVNHTTFRFSCNINAKEKEMLEYEKYLSEIENSFDISKEMQVRKKIAGRYSTNVAYKILTQVEFKINHDNSFITALIPSNLDLSERQIETLGAQLEAVYGINGYYMQEVEDVGYDAQDKGKRNGTEAIEGSTEDTKVGIQTFSKIPTGVPLNAISSTSAWHAIRKSLIEELGEAIDTAWFSKAVAVECNDTKTLTLTMPTKFMADWIRNNYSQMIRRLAGNVGVKRVEYGYDISSKW
ncbi:DnaA-like protein (plasmid) [Rickettsia peacockii str. Rustic]|uniref:DnaA-like protein n=1 Tax=Rickettsia peacockii (strain Rustic) TaxID=562019 RepID=C4K2Z5_RICPU|nr:DnaA N-terminal domain-containing protein [Rickettsia peacockii]ACR47948.1 DnaA-like protein [Rickettsia peacockii str. Rustic]